MFMKKDEILQMYREAKDPVGQRKILADMNCCSISKIDEILGLTKSGLAPKDTRKYNSKYSKADMEKLYYEGLTDSEIAERLGCVPHTVCGFRKELRLPPHSKKPVKKADTAAAPKAGLVATATPAPPVVVPPVVAPKADQGKPRLSLVPSQIIRDIAQVREYGTAKYGSAENWKEVEPARYIDALYRHLLSYIDDPKGVDKESGIEHIKHIACNVAFLCEVRVKL